MLMIFLDDNQLIINVKEIKMDNNLQKKNEELNDEQQEKRINENVNKLKIPMQYIVLIICICSAIIVIAIAIIITSNNKTKEPITETEIVTEIVYVEKPKLPRFEIKPTVITDIQSVQKLEILNIETQTEILLDESFKINWGIFKKQQAIILSATARYTIDLRLITRDDIAYDEDTNKLMVLIPRPILDSITINEDKNEIQEVEKGLFRFGTVDITPNDYNEILIRGKNSIKNDLLLDPENQFNAEVAAKYELSDLISKFIVGNEDIEYEIIIGFKETDKKPIKL